MARGFQPGRAKTGGRPPGGQNKVNREFRETITKLLEENAENISLWLKEVAADDPGKALQHIASLAEYAAPKLARTEVTGKDGGPVQHQMTRLELARRLMFDIEQAERDRQQQPPQQNVQ